MKIAYEHTDTFSGEANYCWVNRGTVDVPENASDRLVMRRVKKALGLSGVRGRVDNYGEQVAFYPYGVCHVVFIGPDYTHID